MNSRSQTIYICLKDCLLVNLSNILRLQVVSSLTIYCIIPHRIALHNTTSHLIVQSHGAALLVLCCKMDNSSSMSIPVSDVGKKEMKPLQHESSITDGQQVNTVCSSFSFSLPGPRSSRRPSCDSISLLYSWDHDLADVMFYQGQAMVSAPEGIDLTTAIQHSVNHRKLSSRQIQLTSIAGSIGA